MGDKEENKQYSPPYPASRPRDTTDSEQVVFRALDPPSTPIQNENVFKTIKPINQPASYRFSFASKESEDEYQSQ